MKKHNRKGFTLMEMLIVVAIIAILIAVAIPTFSSALTNAKAATDEANLRALKGLIVTAYLTEKLEEGTLALPESGTPKSYYLSSDGSSVQTTAGMASKSVSGSIGYECNVTGNVYTFTTDVAVPDIDASVHSFKIEK